MRLWLFIFSLGFLLSAVTAYAGNAAPGPIQIQALEVQGGKVQLRLSMAERNAPTFSLSQEGGKSISLGTADVDPVNLWVLADVSTLCRSKDIDAKLNRLLKDLRSSSHRDTLISLVSYTDSSLEIHHNHKPLKEIENFFLMCQPQSRSASHERALRHLLKAKEATDLPTVAWVFSSGNINLSSDTLQEMRSRRIDTQVVVYNAAVRNEVLPGLSQQKAFLGEERFAYGFADKNLSIPATKYTLEFYAPFDVQGKKTNVRLLAQSKDRTYASAPFTLNLPDSRLKTIWLRWGRYVALGLLLFLLGRAVIALVRYYRPRFCESCQRRIRVADNRCHFCREEGNAYLIGSFNYREKDKVGKRDVLPIRRARTELGTHRKSSVSFIRPQKEKRRLYATLLEENLGSGQRVFRLQRARGSEMGAVRVNQEPLKEERYLCSGDTIEILDQEVGFYVEAKF